MRYIVLSLLLMSSIWSLTVGAQEYRLGVGDRVDISVYNEADLHTQVKVDKSGLISYPFLDDIQVIGLTIKELERVIHNGLLGDYLIQPQVTVSIIEYRPFFIHGEVKRPGSYPYQDDLTLDKAIAIAGGLAARASNSNWTITRDIDGKQATLSGDVSTRIQPDDIIKIEQSFF